MKVITKAVLDMNTMSWLPELEESYQYSGPVALADRAAQGMAKQAFNESQSTAADARGKSQQLWNSVIPGLENEANNSIGYTPQEQNDMLVAGEQGAGGALSGIKGEADLQTARTGNSAGYAGALDEAMREKGRQLSENALGVKNESARLGQKKQMFAQGELGSIMGGKDSEMSKAMGLESQDIQDEIQAGKSGWLQNVTGVINSLSGAASAAAGVKKAW